MKVSTIMSPDPVTIGRRTGLDEALRLMDAHDIRHLPVLEDGVVVGVLSDRDLYEATGWLPARVRASLGLCADGGPERVEEIMQGPVVTTGPDEPVVRASVEFVGRGIGCLPVVLEGRLVGMVTEMDMVRAFCRGCREGWLDPECDLEVGQRMTRAVTTIEQDVSLDAAFAVAHSIEARHLPVVADGQVVGIVSDRDLRRAVGEGRDGETAVDELMTRDIVTVAPDARMSRAAQILTERKISALPVVEDGELVGILTLADLLNHGMDAMRDQDVPRPRAELRRTGPSGPVS